MNEVLHRLQRSGYMCANYSGPPELGGGEQRFLADPRLQKVVQRQLRRAQEKVAVLERVQQLARIPPDSDGQLVEETAKSIVELIESSAEALGSETDAQYNELMATAKLNRDSHPHADVALN